MSAPILTAPTFEHHHNGLGVATARPRISWRFQSSPSTAEAWTQTAYQIEVVFSTLGDCKTETYRIDSQESVLVPWPARPLVSREAATVRVRAIGRQILTKKDDSNSPDIISDWSENATVEAALLDHSELRASFITPAQHIGPKGPLQPIRFRKEFTLPEGDDINRARLYITALGVFNAWINGKPVTDERLAPGWTSYNFRLAYRVLDVTSLLIPGHKNVICAEVAEGWYAGRLGFKGGRRFRYGSELGLFAQLEVHKGHGLERPWTLLTDDTWSTTSSALTSSELYDGEAYDLRLEQDGWNSLDGQWPADSTFGSKVLPRPSADLVALDVAPVRHTETKECIEVLKSASGKIILDFGQNLVGQLFIPSLELAKDQTVTFRHAEVMEHGELGTRPLRDSKCQDTIIGSGQTLKDWTPSFTFHGFRYVQVDGWPTGEPSKNDIQAWVIHTDMRRRGYFECSNPFINQLHSNVVWSMRGNFLSLPTDCPQRDERLGWTGDLQVFCPTASFLYDTMGILGSWLQDVSAEQLQEGRSGIPPLVVPEALSPNWPNVAQAVWDDVTVLAPAALYQYSSDKKLLETQFASMQAWLEQGIDRAPDGLWNPEQWQLADWLDPSAPPEDPGNGRTDSVLVANAYLVHTTSVMAELCAALDKDDLASKYRNDAKRLKALFQRRYITAEGYLMSSSQTGLGLAIKFGLYPEDASQRQTAAKALDRLVRLARFQISTGFAGTPVISHALTQIGRPQLAYRMLLETKCPSWLYPVVSHNATTIWERWDSKLADGSINPGQMTSFNHYALGAVADWLHGSVGGISPLEPGWRKIKVRPVPGGNVTSAKVSFDGPYGLVACEWTLNDDKAFSMKLTVPPSCSAVVTLPSELTQDWSIWAEKSREVLSGTHEFTCKFEAAEWPPKPIVAINQSLPPDTIAGSTGVSFNYLKL